MKNGCSQNFDKLFAEELLQALNNVHKKCLQSISNDYDNARLQWLHGIFKQSIIMDTESIIIKPTKDKLKVSNIVININT